MKDTELNQHAKKVSQRKSGRHIVPVDVDIYNVFDNSHIGLLVNIAVDGLMIIAEREIAVDSILQFEMKFPAELNMPSRIVIGVDCLWSEPAIETGKYWAGFHIIDISEKDTGSLRSLIETHGLELEC